MKKITIEQALEEESKYSAVMAVAKLARKIGDEPVEEGNLSVEKPVIEAIDELKNHKYLIVETDDFKERY